MNVIGAQPDLTGDLHRNLHSEQGGRPGEHCGRSRNPVIRVADIAWLEPRVRAAYRDAGLAIKVIAVGPRPEMREQAA